MSAIPLAASPGMIPPVLLVGCGRMGRALLAGWCEQGLEPSVIIDPVAPPDGLRPQDRLLRGRSELPPEFLPAAVVVAIKPQLAAEVLPDYADLAGRAVVLSIMAGRRLAGLRALLGPAAAIVRAMPNTPAEIRRGVTVACADGAVASAQRALCDRLLRAVGAVAWVDDEALLDPVTAISGSGPAYVFLLAELLEQAGRTQGLPADLARLLARQTIAGAGGLLAERDSDAAALRAAVTSPGGTTERALDVLMQPDAWPRIVAAAVAAATARSRELAG